MNTDEENKCVKCCTTGGELNEIGKFWREDNDEEESVPKKKKKIHPLDAIIQHAHQLEMVELVTTLEESKQNETTVYIHYSCRTELKNHSRPRKWGQPSKQLSSSTLRTRSQAQDYGFDFKRQCFYCGDICKLDPKNPSRKNFELVRTKTTKIYNETIRICETRDNILSKSILGRLLTINDLVAAEGRYHKACRSKFENPLPKFPTPGRPKCFSKMEIFDEACEKLENDDDLYTVSDFHTMMSKLGNDVYSVKMTLAKLKEKYGDSMWLVSREGKSDIIFLDITTFILSEKWYEEQRESTPADEAERVIKTAARLLKDAIKYHEHDTRMYPSTDDIMCPENSKAVPLLLEKFVQGMFKSSLKQVSLSQALFAATRPRSIMPIQFGLAVLTDNQIGSKWLNVLLARLGLAVSYDEVRIFFTN